MEITKSQSIGSRVRKTMGSVQVFTGLLIVLILTIVGFRGVLFAPAIPGWSWTEHRSTLLVIYPKGWCGCGLNSILDYSIGHRFSIIVLTNADDKAVDRITAYYSSITIIRNNDLLRNLIGNSAMPSFRWYRGVLATRDIEDRVPLVNELE